MAIDPNSIRWDSPAPAQPTAIPVPMSPQRQAAETRANNADVRAGNADARAADAAARAAVAQAEANRLAVARLNADLYKDGLMLGPSGTPVPIPGWTPPPGSGASGKALRQGDSDNVRKLGDNLANLQNLADSFQSDYGGNLFGGLENTAQGIFSGVGTPNQRQWWADVASIDNLIRNAQFGASLTAGEKAAYEKTTITPSMDPKEIAKNLTRRVEIMQDAARRYTGALKAGGWNGQEIDAYVAPQLEWLPPEKRGTPERQQQNAMAQTFIDPSSGATAAPFGATTQQQKLPPAMQAEYDAYIAKGDFDPDRFVAFRKALDAKYGFGTDEAGNRAFAEHAQQVQRQGGTIRTQIPAPEVPLSGVDRLRNNLVSNPVGAGIANFANMYSAGVPEALAGSEQFQALNEANPISATIGQVGGSIFGTNALGKLGTKAAGTFAPRLLGGGKAAETARGVLNDAAYSAIYGDVTGRDPLATAGEGTLGSIGGRALGSTLGKVVGGVQSSPTIASLRDMGVTPTVGQIFRGRAADNGGRSVVAGMEDLAANSGWMGTLVNDARTRALEDANLAAFNRVSGGAPITAIGAKGVDQLGAAKDAAYSRALDGVSVTADPTFAADIAAARTAGTAADAARGRGDYRYVMDRMIDPAAGTGPQYLGQQIQDALRVAQSQSRAYQRAANGAMPDPAAMGVSNALDDTTDAYTGLVSRQAPSVMPALKEANAINRGLSILDDATVRSMNEGSVFTGAQLGDAMKANASRFGGKNIGNLESMPLYELQQNMQKVLPNKIPPTGVNAAPALALAGAASTGTGYATDNEWLKTLGYLAMLTTPYTKSGQAAAAKALLDRPVSLQNAGSLIRKHKGLFGSAAVPLSLEAFGQ